MLKKRIVWIKGKKEVLIKVDGVWVYKYRRCGCPCNGRISYITTNVKNYKQFGVPKHIRGHQNVGRKRGSKYDKNFLKNNRVIIKGKIEQLIIENGVLVYKYHRCGCPCNNRIPFFKIHLWNGVPNHISNHYQYTDEFREMQSKKMSGENNFWFGKHPKSEFKKGKNHIMYGTHLSKKTRKLLSKINTGEGNGFFGKHHTLKTRKKMSGRGPDASGENNHMYGKPSPKGSGRSIGCHYRSPLQGKVWLRSTYELGYAKYLDSKRVLWKHEHRTFTLSNGTSYTPDFYLVKKKKYVEIKGYTSKIAQEKMNLFRQEYPDIKFKILYSEDLVRKGIL